MARFVCVLVAATAALTVALPASADGGRSAHGIVAAVSGSRIVVRAEQGALRCAVTADSPSVGDYSRGDRVALACRRTSAGHLVLTRISHLPARSTPAPADPAADSAAERVSFAGAVTALGTHSVSLHDGDRDLTCTLGASSPELTGVVVGVHIRVVCVDGALVSFETLHAPAPPAPAPAPAPATAPAVTPPNGVVAFGSISALSPTLVTIHNDEHGDLTCALGAASPLLGDYRVGDRVRLACSDGRVLLSISRY